MTEEKTPGNLRAAFGSVAADSETTAFGQYTFGSRLLEKDGKPVKLGSRATDILRLLLSRPGEVVSKSELLAFAWAGLAVEEISLRVHVAELRKALGDGQGGTRYITNVPSRGYCFVAPVRRAARPPIPAKALAPTASLPHRLDRMIGRDDVVRDLSAAVLSDRLVTLRGPGGIGKTTVAVAVAHELWHPFAGQLHFLDLGPLKDAALVAGTVAAALGLVVHHADPAESVVNLLRDQHVLLVLDSCEHVIDGVARLAERIHSRTPHVHIMATSRESLLVEGEHVVELASLPVPPPGAALSAGDVLNYPAARLFVERAAAAGHPGELADHDAKALVEICGKLDGIALAIELAAARAGFYGLQEMAALLDGRLKLEWRGRRTAPPRHQTLGATLDWSFGLIGESERRLLRRLSIFAGSFTLDGAIAVATDAETPVETLLEALEQLVAKSLVLALRDGASRRYRLLDVTRAYASKKLADTDETSATANRHARYVQSTLEATMAEADGDHHASRASARASLLADARAALEWNFGNDEDIGLRRPLAGACVRLFVELNLLNEARLWSIRALDAPDNAEPGDRWELELQSTLGHAAMFTERNGDQAETALRRGLEIAEALDDRANTFRLLARLNMFYRRTGDFRHLLPLALEAERVAVAIGDAAGIAGAKALLGVSHHLVGNQTAAQLQLNEGLQHDEALRGTQPGHFAYARTPQIPLARVLWLRGFPDQALDCIRPLIGSAPRDVVMHCVALCWSASVFGWVGDWVAVEEITERLTAHAGMHGLATYDAVATAIRGQCLIARGELQPGIEHLQAALPRLRADRYELYATAFVADLSQALAKSGKPDKALMLLRQAVTRAESEGGSFDMPELLRLRGELEWRTGDPAAGAASLESSVAFAEQQGSLSWRLRADMSLARLRQAQRRENPLEGVAATYARFAEGFGTADLMNARAMLEAAAGRPATRSR